MNEENKGPDSSPGEDENSTGKSGESPAGKGDTPREADDAASTKPGAEASATESTPGEPAKAPPAATPPAGMPMPPGPKPPAPAAPPPPPGPYAPAGPPPGRPPASVPGSAVPPPGQPPGEPHTAGMPAPGAAPRSKRGPLIAAVIGGAVALALLSGGIGGIVGYGLSAGNANSSSPSEVVDGATVSDVAAAVQPSVVSISAGEAEGSGVVYDKEGNIITNNHVAESAQGGKVEVAFADGSTSPAEVVATDPAGDLAVIKASDANDLKPIKFGDSDGLKVGDTTLAIGSPLGLQGSVTSGIVSALDRTVQAGGEQGGAATTLNGLIQTDAAINPGNSGGALVNGKGELVGINTVIATAGGSEGSVGLGFAIPSSTVKETAEQLVDSGSVERAFLGVGLTDSVEGDGAIVTNVESGSPAEKAGLERRDIITGIDDTEVKAASDVVSTVQSASPGSEVSIDYKRDGKEENVKVELGSSD